MTDERLHIMYPSPSGFGMTFWVAKFAEKEVGMTHRMAEFPEPEIIKEVR